MIRVLIADDQPLIRAAVADLLESAADMEVVGQASDGAEAVEMALRHRPDVLLMDIRMPRLDGIGATAAVCARVELEDTRVLILTTFEEDEYVVQALRAGASGFIGKGSEPEEIADAVRAVHVGEALLSAPATRALIQRYLKASDVTAKQVSLLEPLTEREREVLTMVGRGASNDELAAALYISPHTAKTHVKRLMTKLDVHDRAQLVIAAYETGLVTPGE